MWQHVKLSDVSLGKRPRYSLVSDEDVKKSNQTNNYGIPLLLLLLFQFMYSSDVPWVEAVCCMFSC